MNTDTITKIKDNLIGLGKVWQVQGLEQVQLSTEGKKLIYRIPPSFNPGIKDMVKDFLKGWVQRHKNDFDGLENQDS